MLGQPAFPPSTCRQENRKQKKKRASRGYGCKSARHHFRGITQWLEWGAYISLVVGSNPTSPTKLIKPYGNKRLKLNRFETVTK